MRILITGGFGYIGGHFVKRLKGHETIVIDNFCQGRNNIIKGVKYKNVDIRNHKKLLKVFEDFKPDVVVHYAAIANVQYALTDPAYYYDNNVTGTLNVLDCMRKVGCKKIIFSSTAALYGEADGLMSEDSLIKPTTAYGYTKLVGEEILKDYYRAYGINSISFRYFCAVGCDEELEVGCYHEPEMQVIPNLVKTFLGKQEVFNVWGNDFPTPDGTAIRDYIHVNDLADAHILALDKLEGCKVYNLGINKGFSVLELIKAGEEVIGQKLNWKFGPRRPADGPKLIADSSKAQRELGWTPKYLDIGKIILTDYNFFKSL